MKKLFLMLVIAILGVLMLFSCETEDIPEGLEVVAISEKDGIKFYGPEGWTVVNDVFNSEYKIYATRLSGRSKTSLTFVEAPMPEEDIAKYFSDSLATLPAGISATLNVTKQPTKVTFGNAGEAHSAIYTYKYTEYDYTEGKYVEKDMTCLQYFIKNAESFYIFTYTAYGKPDDAEGDYAKYLDLVLLSAEHFKFTSKGTSSDAPIYEKDGDGYNLVSDKTLCGYELYLPDGYEVVGTNGDVEAKISDSAALSITRASDTGVNILTYLKLRHQELSAIVSDIADEKVYVRTEYDKTSPIFDEWDMEMPIVDASIKFGDLQNVAVYEYTYFFGGVKYRVYQVLGVDSFTGYVLTYTASENEYEAHLDTIKIILEKVKF